jgi:hypothetical protein
MLTQLTDRETIRRYLRALRREQLLARVQRDEERVERLLVAQTVAVDAAPQTDHYSAHRTPLNYMLSLLDQPRLRNRVSAISIDLAVLNPDDRRLLKQILLRADVICRLRAPQPS